MYWDEDIDFMVGKKQAPKVGRRAGQQSNDGDNAAAVSSENETRKSSAPMQPRKSGGWADEGSKSAKAKHMSNLIEEERFQTEQKYDSDDDVPIIPDIEELQDDIYSLQEIQAPPVSVNKATYKELDSELLHLHKNQSAFGKFTDINLSYLSNKLQAEKDVQDPDVVWTMEMLSEKVLALNSGS